MIRGEREGKERSVRGRGRRVRRGRGAGAATVTGTAVAEPIVDLFDGHHALFGQCLLLLGRRVGEVTVGLVPAREDETGGGRVEKVGGGVTGGDGLVVGDQGPNPLSERIVQSVTHHPE